MKLVAQEERKVLDVWLKKTDDEVTPETVEFEKRGEFAMLDFEEEPPDENECEKSARNVKDDEIDGIGEKGAIFVFDLKVISICVGYVVGDVFDLGLGVGEKLVGVPDEGEEGEFHVLDSADGLEYVVNIFAIGPVVVLVHPEPVHG